jgi:hypothetical protein
VSLLCSCHKPCNEEKKEYHYIDSSEKAKIIYTGFETLTFLHNHKDTVYFHGTGVQNYLNDLTIGTDACPKPIIYGEGRQFLFKDQLGLNKIYLNQDYYDGPVTNVSFNFESHLFIYISVYIDWGKDTLTVLTNTYNNVSVPYPRTSKVHDSLYYDRDYGIIKVVTESEVWERIN